MSTEPQDLVIRQGTVNDADTILRFIKELAVYENELDQVKMTADQLKRDGWPSEEELAQGASSRFEVLMAEQPLGNPIGFALFFYNYSTWEGTGLYLEDLYIQPDFRGAGVGKCLIRAVAQRAMARNCARFQWQAIDFNDPAIRFYKQLGARERVETGEAKWLNFIMSREELIAFAQSGPMLCIEDVR